MKYLHRIAVTLPLITSAYSDPEAAYQGFSFDPNNSAHINPILVGGSSNPGTTLEIGSYNGGILLFGNRQESARGVFDGGVTIAGNPVSILLATYADPLNWNRGKFSIWSDSRYFSGELTTPPLFEISSPEGTATFTALNVAVNDGSLSVAGSPVLTQAGSQSYLASVGFLQSSGLSAALSSISPPTNSNWSSVYVTRGNVQGDGWMAHGTSQASGSGSIASGSSNASGNSSIAFGSTAVASGGFSQAMGLISQASGTYSYARGWSSVASGTYSTAIGRDAKGIGNHSTAVGLGVEAKSYAETVFGNYNTVSTTLSPSAWNYSDALFRIGNGNHASFRRDAVMVTKVGKTTLTNIAWKGYQEGSEGPLYVPTDPQWGESEALVVEGHTRLKGRVVIEQPQGDISMGIYE